MTLIALVLNNIIDFKLEDEEGNQILSLTKRIYIEIKHF